MSFYSSVIHTFFCIQALCLTFAHTLPLQRMHQRQLSVKYISQGYFENKLGGNQGTDLPLPPESQPPPNSHHCNKICMRENIQEETWRNLKTGRKQKDALGGRAALHFYLASYLKKKSEWHCFIILSTDPFTLEQNSSVTLIVVFCIIG